MAANGFEKGFSLLELMVALAILSVGMSAIGAILLTAFETDRHNSNMRNADIILRRVAEAFAAGNPESLPPGPSPATGTGSAVIRGQANVTTGGQTVTGLNFISGSDTHPGGYYCTWNVSTYKTSLAGAVNRIDIVVGWGNGPNCSRDTPGLCPYHMQVTNYY